MGPQPFVWQPLEHVHQLSGDAVGPDLGPVPCPLHVQPLAVPVTLLIWSGADGGQCPHLPPLGSPSKGLSHCGSGFFQRRWWPSTAGGWFPSPYDRVVQVSVQHLSNLRPSLGASSERHLQRVFLSPHLQRVLSLPWCRLASFIQFADPLTHLFFPSTFLLSGFLGVVLSVITLVEAGTRESLPGSCVCRK